jgi:hypothetical protein
MSIEAEMREIKQHVFGISEKIDKLMYEREMTTLMKLAEKPISEFFEEKPDIYQIAD